MSESPAPLIAAQADAPARQPRWRPRWFSLADGLASRQDNFLLLRMIAAALVIYGHSLAIVGSGPKDLFVWLGLGSYSGSIAVDIFFVVSGFLITGSYLRRRNIFAYSWARALRIVPAYLTCLVVLAFVVGAVDTTLSLREYLTNPATRDYVTTNIKFDTTMIWNLPGVFDGHVKRTIDGSLWTLPAEVRMYAWVALLGLVGILSRRWLFVPVALGLIGLGVFFPTHVPMVPIQMFLRLAGMFAIGAICYVLRERIPVHGALVLGFALIGCLVRHTFLYPYVFALAETVFVFWFAYRLRWYGYNRFGDYSYGLYLWGYPVQQMVVSFFPNIGSLVNAAISLPIAVLFGIVSWYAVERPALMLKDWPGRMWNRLESMYPGVRVPMQRIRLAATRRSSIR